MFSPLLLQASTQVTVYFSDVFVFTSTSFYSSHSLFLGCFRLYFYKLLLKSQSIFADVFAFTSTSFYSSHSLFSRMFSPLLLQASTQVTVYFRGCFRLYFYKLLLKSQSIFAAVFAFTSTSFYSSHSIFSRMFSPLLLQASTQVTVYFSDVFAFTFYKLLKSHMIVGL